MTYQEMIETRAQRQAESDKDRSEWLKNADIEQMETDAIEAQEIQSLGIDEE